MACMRDGPDSCRTEMAPQTIALEWQRESRFGDGYVRGGHATDWIGAAMRDTNQRRPGIAPKSASKSKLRYGRAKQRLAMRWMGSD